MTVIPDNRKIRSEQIKGISGGGDVTQAGNNNFTGENDFANVPTSQEDATLSDELVRLGQLQKSSSSLTGVTLTSEFGDDYTFTTVSNTLTTFPTGLKVVTIIINNINDIGSPSGKFSINFDTIGSVALISASLILFSGSTLTNVEKYVPRFSGTDEIYFTDVETGATASGISFTNGQIRLECIV